VRTDSLSATALSTTPCFGTVCERGSVRGFLAEDNSEWTRIKEQLFACIWQLVRGLLWYGRRGRIYSRFSVAQHNAFPLEFCPAEVKNEPDR
jgi:hypothetical protein